MRFADQSLLGGRSRERVEPERDPRPVLAFVFDRRSVPDRRVQPAVVEPADQVVVGHLRVVVAGVLGGLKNGPALAGHLIASSCSHRQIVDADASQNPTRPPAGRAHCVRTGTAAAVPAGSSHATAFIAATWSGGNDAGDPRVACPPTHPAAAQQPSSPSAHQPRRGIELAAVSVSA